MGQIAAESPREQTLGCGSGFGAGFNHHTPGPFYTNWGLQTCCQSPTVGQHVATAHHPVDPRFELPVETCVDDEISCEIVESALSEEMVSSWSGISGAPGLGYSIRPKEGCELETCELAINTAQQVQDILNSEPEWSANSAQNLASLRVDLPRVNHHDLIRSRTVSVHNPLQPPTASAASKQPHNAASKSGNGSGGYNGVSAVGHLMSDSVNFERHNPAKSASKNAKRPLRATVSSRLKSKLSLPASWPSSGNGSGNAEGDQKQPNSLPSQFIPRAPIPTPEVLAAARNNKAAKQQQQQTQSQRSSMSGSGQNSIPHQHGSGQNSIPHAQHISSPTRPQKSQQDSFSANNDAILKQEQIYQVPKDREGDYSYAYDCSISPAVVIKWNEENQSDENDSDFGTEESNGDQDSNLGSPVSDVDLKPVRRGQQASVHPPNISQKKSKQKTKLARKKSSLPAGNFSNKLDAENIYEEIEDVKAQSASSSINNSDSGIGGLTSKSLNSYGSSSASKSSSGGSTGNGNGFSTSKGTLDVSRPRHKKSSNSEQGKSAMAAAAERAKRKQESGIPLSSLDALISQTSPGLTAHQKLSLRRSLVDELFEELIQRHHRRVLDELRLDVEEFIAPSPVFIDLAAENSSNISPKSSRSSAQSCSKLHRCESMDFKNSQNNFKKNDNVQVEQNNSSSGGQRNAAEPNKKIGSKLWQSARKCTEVIQRKLKKSSLDLQQQQNSQLPSANSATAGSISSPSTNFKPSISGPNLPPPVPPHQHLVSGALNLQSQVPRRGHRPLSAIVTTSNNNNNSKMKISSNSVNKEPVIDTLEDDLSDNEQEDADRRLLRSKIIKSFWEQHDQEGGDFSEPELSSDKR